jgi:hypothetical protein
MKLLERDQYNYEMSVKDCFLSFPLTEQKTHKTYEFGQTGCSAVALSVAFDKDVREVQRTLPDFDETTADRLARIQAYAQDLCMEVSVDYKGMKPLDHGKGAVVVQVNDDYVIRMQRGKLPERPESAHVLQAVGYKFLPEENVTMEVLPKLNTEKVTYEHVMQVFLDAQPDGIYFWDKTTANVGLNKDGKPLILDPDSFSITQKPTPKI